MTYIKLICVKIGNFKHHKKLKIGNIYNGVPLRTFISDIYDEGNINGDDFSKYYIVDIETGHEYGYYDKDFFIDLDEYREHKINTILNG